MTRRTSLVATLGQETAAVLAERCGGRRLIVPAEVSRIEYLARVVGSREVATLLVFHFAGCRLYIPVAHAPGERRAIDDRKVARLDRKGWSASRIARKLGCSDRTIHAARSRNKTKSA